MDRAVIVLLTVCCLLQWPLATTGRQPGIKHHFFYAVEMDGGTRAAQALAEQHGLQFISRIGNLEGHFTLRDSRRRPDRAALVNTLAERAGVRWVQRQQTHYRDKRAVIRGLEPHHKLQQQQSELPSRRQDTLKTEDQLSHSLTFNDPLWPMQWELFNHGQYSASHFDLNVMPVWSRNITGNGVVVSIVDDGVDHTNMDLKRNFEAFASFDLRGSHGLSHDPMPLRDEENGHGTRCAGEVAMEANNSYCGVGIAFNARVGGIRLLDGTVTDSMEATSLTFNNDFIDVYVCCWGPRDDGQEMAGPGTLTQKALRLGTQKGRGGKGSIFVWASGNGGLVNDHCGADGYVNSVYSIAIGAVTHMGKPAFFGEPCPAVMAVTLTGASLGNTLPLVTVSNLGDGCVTHFAGTSSAAPIAAGILALVLEANPDLTWRDMQHLIAMTAKVPDPKEPGWSVNGAGYHIHDRYGFGVLDAGLMVQQALQFQAVTPQRKCTQEVTLDPIRILPSGGEVSVNIQSADCLGTDAEVNTLEHVQVKVSLSSVCRGDLSIALVSPAGTVSLLLATRSNDDSAAGLRNWTLMSVQSWGEHPHGVWTLKVTDNKGTVGRCVRVSSEEAAGALLSVTLLLYGTYNPHRSLHEEPLQSFLSMGAYHHVPRAGLYVRDRYPPQDLIQRAFELERDRKVGTDDIPVPRQRKNSELVIHPVQSFNSLDLDDTDGADLHSHLKLMWNTLRDKVKTNWFLYKSITGNQSPQLRWADIALRNFLGAGPVVGVEPPGMMHKLRDSVGGVTRSSPPQKRTPLLRDVAVDVGEMHLMDLLRTSRADHGQGHRPVRARGTVETASLSPGPTETV
ncbi:PC3-like endoprotease variant B [Salvelinus fontinalis]|uniref:PC3-like endoprotease variant B n=1 Tax=Salvelinus fontinalis TaxID=8038 RepID=UPI0024860A7B|nr:PC3-like endoprotease variant B [Salvelinus fontinalis]